MRRYLQVRDRRSSPQALALILEQEAYFPLFAHAAVDQDRPLGDASTYQEHMHDLYHIVLYTRSSGVYVKTGTTYQAKSGSLVIISPGESHNFVDTAHPTAYSELTFCFSTASGKLLTLPFEELLKTYTGVSGQLTPDPVLPKDTAQEVTMGMIQVIDYLQSPSALADFYAYRSLAHIFDLIVAHCYAESTPASGAGADAGILKVRQYIEEHYAESVTADRLAALSHRSKGHLFNLFKKAFGASPLSYQQALRIDAAQRLLRFTSLSCYAVALRVGYSNVPYFHRQFRKRTGMTPQQYRRFMRQPPENEREESPRAHKG